MILLLKEHFYSVPGGGMNPLLQNRTNIEIINSLIKYVFLFLIMVKRVFIVGYSGSGKNWLGEQLSKKSGIKFYDQDDFAWIKKFTIERPWKVKARMLAKVCEKDKWVICGAGFSYLGDIPKRAEVIIILKTSPLRNFLRHIKRYTKRKIKGEEDSLKGIWEMTKGNREESKPTGRAYKFFKELKKKYPKKVKILTNKEKHKFLKNF